MVASFQFFSRESKVTNNFLKNAFQIDYFRRQIGHNPHSLKWSIKKNGLIKQWNIIPYRFFWSVKKSLTAAIDIDDDDP